MMALAAPAAAAPVTWDFIGTGLVSCAIPSLCVPLPPLGLTIATLVLPDETSAGHTTFEATPVSSHPIKIGDDFVFRAPILAPVSQTSPPDGVPQTPSLFGAQSFDISWSEVAGVLLGVFVDFATTFDDARILGSLARLASDRTFGPCTNTQCEVTGEWERRDLGSTRVPEPSTAGLILAGLLSFLVMGLSRRSS